MHVVSLGMLGHDAMIMPLDMSHMIILWSSMFPTVAKNLSSSENATHSKPESCSSNEYSTLVVS